MRRYDDGVKRRLVLLLLLLATGAIVNIVVAWAVMLFTPLLIAFTRAMIGSSEKQHAESPRHRAVRAVARPS